MPYFLIDKPLCIFIHIPKTGGTSIREGFFQSDYNGPFFKGLDYSHQNLFKFAFVRNPFDRLVSAWKMFFCDFQQQSLRTFFEIVKDDSIIFDERRRSIEEKIRHHTLPQTHQFYMLDKADFIGRFENLENDFSYVCKKLKIKYKALPHLNKSQRSPDYQKYFSPSLITDVSNFYKNDLELLKYSF